MCLEQSNQGSKGGGEGGAWMGQVVQGRMGFREDLGFYPEGGGIPGGLWAEGDRT